MNNRHRQYSEYEKTAIWRSVNRAITALVKNGDLEERTARRYIVGYLSKFLSEDGFQQVAELRKGHKVLRVIEVSDRPHLKVAS